MKITQQDILNAKQAVENFLTANKVVNIYNPSLTNSWGIYVNWTNKTISIHGPSSPDWKRVVNSPGKIINTFSITSNGMWIGPFLGFEIAYAFSELFRRILYLNTHEEVTVASGRGISYRPFKLF